MAIELKIKKNCWKELLLYAQETDSEISGFGKVVFEKDVPPEIVKLVLLKQVCSAANTMIDDEDLASYLEQDKDRKSLKVWWHSHNDMSCFWSPTDESTIAKLLHWTNYIFSIVVNKKGEHKARLDLQYPFGLDILIEEAEVYLNVIEPVNKKLLAKVRKLIAEKVSDKVYPEYNYYSRNYEQGKIWDTATRKWIERVEKVDISAKKEIKKIEQNKSLATRFYNYDTSVEICYRCKTHDCANCDLWDSYMIDDKIDKGVKG